MGIESIEVSDEHGYRTVYSYHRLIVAALTVTDIESAVARDFNGDEVLLDDAIFAAKAVML